MSILRLRGVTVERGGRRLLDAVDLVVADGEVVGLLGPNGSGKSTLIRTAYGALRAGGGTVRLAGLEVGRVPPQRVARVCAVLTQDHVTDLELPVLDVVLLGRIPHGRSRGAADRALAECCLARVDAGELRDRSFPTLSGGERQRVMLARALCQEPRLLLLDEPTNHLDVAHQLHLLEVVRSAGTACLVALHDLSLAATYCDRLVLLDQGRVVAHGPPSEVLTPERLAAVYGVDSVVLPHPVTGAPLVAVSRPGA